MKRKILSVILLTLSVILLGCSLSNLADVYTEDDVIARAKETVDVINTLDYDAINNEFRDDLEEQIEKDTIKDAWDAKLSAAGEFKEYKSIVTYGQKSQTTDEDYAVVVISAIYENETLIYTISMDADYEIVGMFMK